MKKILLPFVLIGLVTTLFSACDTEPAQSKPSIFPSSTRIRFGESIEFTASGGYEYEWSLENDSYGALNTRRGPKVVYKSFYNPSSATGLVTQILHVRSFITGSSQSTNSSTAYQQEAEAYISHVYTQP